MDSRFDFSKFEPSAIFFCDDCKRFTIAALNSSIGVKAECVLSPLKQLLWFHNKWEESGQGWGTGMGTVRDTWTDRLLLVNSILDIFQEYVCS